jgi:hypothetical protein
VAGCEWVLWRTPCTDISGMDRDREWRLGFVRLFRQPCHGACVRHVQSTVVQYKAWRLLTEFGGIKHCLVTRLQPFFPTQLSSLQQLGLPSILLNFAFARLKYEVLCRCSRLCGFRV